MLELRALARVHGQHHTTSGYFDDHLALMRAACERSGRDTGVYVTINPVHPALLARGPKNTLRRASSGDTTGDRDVRQRRSLLIDVDPVRPAGISSSHEEHAAAIALSRTIRTELRGLGWPEPILADSGNGGHLIYAVDLPVDDGGLVRRVLAKLAMQFGSSDLVVDERVFNPARISKIYGTLTRKGEDTVDRPHRLARILEAPDRLEVVARETLEAFAPIADAKRQVSSGQPFDLDAWIARHLPDARERSWSAGRRWILPICPFDPAHDRGEAFVTQDRDGKISAGCQHNSCFKSWRELRSHLEPLSPERSSNGPRVSYREPPPEVLYEHEARARIASPREVRATPAPWRTAPDLVDEIWAHKDDPWISLRLGAEELCRVRAGGIVVVMGGSGSGKSSLVGNLLLQHARDVGPAIALSIELPADEFAARIVGIQCDASWEDVLRGNVVYEHMRQALALPRFYVLDRKQATLETLVRCTEEIRRQHPGEPILAAIDYAQLIQSPERDIRLRVADAISRIDDVSRGQGIVTIAVSQMSRAAAAAAAAGEKIGAESASLGAESAAIERFASITIAIGQRGEPCPDSSQAVEVSIGKGRMSDLGDRVLPARYWGRTGRWRLDGEPRPASQVRAERDASRQEHKQRDVRNLLVGAAHRSGQPVSRNDLIDLVTKGSRRDRLAAIKELLAAGELVEVTRCAPRSRSRLLWTMDRVNATPGLEVYRDQGEGDD